MKSISVLITILAVSAGLYAYDEKCLPNLEVPMQLFPYSLEAGIEHRFSRVPSADFPDNFITYALSRIGLRSAMPFKIALGASYQFMPKEFDLNAGYAFSLPRIFLRAQPTFHWCGAQADDGTHWYHDPRYQLDLQTYSLFDFFSAAFDVAYDDFLKKWDLGMGLDISLTEGISLVGEYIPVIGTRDTLFSGQAKVNSYSAGVRFTTAGHHFVLLVSNSTDMGMRHLVRGANGNSLFYGFNIQRMVSF